MKLAEKIQTWLEAGLLEEKQATAILEFESNRDSRPYAMYSFIILGISVIGIGIISLIAANWEAIPGYVKLTVDFLILGGIVVGILLLQNQPRIQYALVVLYCLLILASIGLISQVFHTGGEFYQALLLATAITAPLLVFFDGRFLHHLWLLGFSYAVLGWMHDLFQDTWASDLVNVLTLGSALLLISLVMRSLEQKLQNLRGAVFFWALLWLIVAAVAFSFADYGKPDISGTSVETFILIPGILLVCSAAYSFFLLPRSLTRRLLILITFGLLYVLVFLSIFVFPVGDKSLYLAIIFVLLAMMAAIVFFDRRFVFDLFLVIAGIRFLIIYFDLFEDLATTGLGLILAGLLIIGGVVLYAKSRSKIQNFLAERMK